MKQALTSHANCHVGGLGGGGSLLLRLGQPVLHSHDNGGPADILIAREHGSHGQRGGDGGHQVADCALFGGWLLVGEGCGNVSRLAIEEDSSSWTKVECIPRSMRRISFLVDIFEWGTGV